MLPRPRRVDRDRDVFADPLPDFPLAPLRGNDTGVDPGRDIKVVPPTSGTAPNKCALSVLIDNPYDWNIAIAEVRIQIGFELDVESRPEGLLAVLSDVQGAPNDASGPIGTDYILRADCMSRARGIDKINSYGVVANTQVNDC